MKNESNEHSNDQFLVAIATGNIEAVKAFLAAGQTLSCMTVFSETPLWAAIMHQRFAIVQLLLEHGANPDEIFRDYTPLGFAAMRGDLALFKLLIKHGANPNKVSGRDTPLTLAAKYGKDHVIDLFVEHLQSLGSTNPIELHGNVALDCAVYGAHPSTVEKLLNHKDTLHIDQEGLDLALYKAARYGFFACIEVLIKHGANVNCRIGHTTPLLEATACICVERRPERDYIKTVKTLLAHSTDINTKDDEDETALIFVGGRGNNLSMVKLLVESGADIDYNVNDMDVLRTANAYEHYDIVAYLFSVHKYDINNDPVCREMLRHTLDRIRIKTSNDVLDTLFPDHPKHSVIMDPIFEKIMVKQFPNWDQGLPPAVSATFAHCFNIGDQLIMQYSKYFTAKPDATNSISFASLPSAITLNIFNEYLERPLAKKAYDAYLKANPAETFNAQTNNGESSANASKKHSLKEVGDAGKQDSGTSAKRRKHR